MTFRPFFAIITMACLLAALAAAVMPILAAEPTSGPSGLDEEDSLIFFESFESTTPEWHMIDLTALATWHRDRLNACGGSGMSWWVGDTILGGYDNIEVQYLETPAVDLSAASNPLLEFDAFWAVEDTIGGYPPGYDGWDGVNVWVSADGGVAWHVLPVQSPAYTCASLASFGVTWTLGPGIAGWAGFSGGQSPGSWVHATASLAGYVSSAVKLRFGLASDEQICTRNDPTLTGFFVDNLNLHDGATVYLQDNAEGQAIPSELLPISGMIIAGQNWHLEETTFPPPPSASHVMRLSNAAGSYNPGLNNALVSPRINLMELSADSVLITADFYIRGTINVNDPEEWPKLDFWTIQITPDEGANWYGYSDPWGQGSITDLWISANNNYTLFSEMSGNPIDLTPYAGYAVRLRVLFCSDGDTLAGEGLFVDNFWADVMPIYGVQDPEAGSIPAQFALEQNRPNPFNPSTVLGFELQTAGFVNLAIYAVSGQIVTTLANGWRTAGRHEVVFDGSGLPSGIYIYRLEADGITASKKMVLLK